MKQRFRVGIVGLSAERGWAAAAHLPALRALSDEYELIGVANTSHASAKAAAFALGIPRAFENVAELVASPDVDIVVVTVKLPYHRNVVAACLQAGKNVYCEWPLANSPAEVMELARLAAEKQALVVMGTQAVVSPEVEFVRKLVADGYVGEVLSSTYIGCSSVWGDEVTSGEAYAMDAKNGVTLLSIIGGHAISAIQRVLGQITEVAAITAQRRRNVRVVETGELIPMTAADQVLISAVLHSGAPLAFQLRGGSPHGTKLRWEINGTKGDLRITARFEPVPVINISPLRVEGGQKEDAGYAELSVPESYYSGFEDQPVARNVANIYRLMAKDLRDGTRTAPNIDDAVSLHRTIWAIEESANTGRHVPIG